MAASADGRLADDVNTFTTRLKQRFENCVRTLQTNASSKESVSQVIHELDFLEKQLMRVRGELLSNQAADEYLSCVNDLLTEAYEMLEKKQDDNGYRAADMKQSGRGAAKKDITKEQLQFFVKLNMTAPRMASVLQCSESCIRRRLRHFGLKLREFQPLSDEELDTKVRSAIGGNKQIGAEAVRARLKAGRVNVPRQRVRESMERVDPVGVALRALKPKMQRATYSVCGPNSLWHIDGNHKLIRYRIVIHAGIDGASRLLVFAAASPNNLASTVFKNFVEAVSEYGLPSRIRVDQGVENADICLFMELIRGPNRGSAIRGKSCHNQRIERLWVDMWNGVTNKYYTIFAYLEDRQLLDPSSDIDVWALHFVFLPRINADICTFRCQWNKHGLSTENGRSPEELFAVGMLEQQNGNLTAIHDVFHSDGVPMSLPIPQERSSANLADEGRTIVSVPALDIALSEEQLEIINTTLDPQAEVEDHGMGIYVQARHLIQQLLGVMG